MPNTRRPYSSLYRKCFEGFSIMDESTLEFFEIELSQNEDTFENDSLEDTFENDSNENGEFTMKIIRNRVLIMLLIILIELEYLEDNSKKRKRQNNSSTRRIKLPSSFTGINSTTLGQMTTNKKNRDYFQYFEKLYEKSEQLDKEMYKLQNYEYHGCGYENRNIIFLNNLISTLKNSNKGSLSNRDQSDLEQIKDKFKDNCSRTNNKIFLFAKN